MPTCNTKTIISYTFGYSSVWLSSTQSEMSKKLVANMTTNIIFFFYHFKITGLF